MKLSENEYQNYTAILRAELIPAMGCTEPIAIAYAAAEARRLLGEMPTRITVNCSGNMIKNVKGVTVPNSGGQKGIEVAAILGRFFRNYPFLCFPTYLSFASNKRFLQRPYIVRFIIFNRLFVPSTKPLL